MDTSIHFVPRLFRIVSTFAVPFAAQFFFLVLLSLAEDTVFP